MRPPPSDLCSPRLPLPSTACPILPLALPPGPPHGADLLSVVESVAAHPLPALLAAGVACTINADDPLLFGCSLLSEFKVCREVLGLSDQAIAACARASFVRSTPLPAAARVLF